MKVSESKNTVPMSFSVRDVMLMILHWCLVIGFVLAVVSTQSTKERLAEGQSNPSCTLEVEAAGSSQVCTSDT